MTTDTADQGGARRVAFALGANLGDTLAALQGAVDLLAAEPGIEPSAVSPVYETGPVGGPEQPRYLNAVLLASSAADPAELLAAAHRAEQAFDRTREVRWGPRTLDVDVLVVGALVSDDPAITLPHPRAHERGFVLVPWAEVDPAAAVPGRGTVAALLAALPAAELDVVRRDDLPLELPGPGGGC